MDTLVTLQRVRDTEAHARKAFVARLSGLDQIRAQIYLSGTYVRDLLLSPDPDTAKAQATHLATLKRETYQALDAYGRELEPEEREPFLALRNADRRLLEGTRCHRRVVAAGTGPPATLVLLQRTGPAAHGHASDRGPHRLGERTWPDAFGGAVGRLGGQSAALPHVDLRGHAGRRSDPGAADDRLHAPAGAGTRPAPGGLAGTLDAAAARTGKRAPRAGARASRRNRAVAIGDPDGDGRRRMRGPGRPTSASTSIRSRGWRKRRSTRCATWRCCFGRRCWTISAWRRR